MNKMLANILLFQAGWFACVLSMASGKPLVGILIVFTFLILHLFTSPNFKREFIFVITIASLGASIDSLLTYNGWLDLKIGNDSMPLVFAWFIAFWANAATTFNRSLAWLQKRSLIAFFLGTISGPSAYFGAQALDALSLPRGAMESWLVLGAYWAIALPLVMWAASSFIGPHWPSKTMSAKSSSEGGE